MEKNDSNLITGIIYKCNFLYVCHLQSLQGNFKYDHFIVYKPVFNVVLWIVLVYFETIFVW